MSEPQHNPPEETSPMSRAPSYIQFVPKRAMASFDNLVVLANYEERLREARRAVWRDRGEMPIEVHDVRECVVHASRGSLRAGGLALAIRAGINFFILMARIKKVPRSYRFTMIRHAIFGEEPVRFAAMIGSFVGLYKLMLNALPLLLPERSDSTGNQFRVDVKQSQRPGTSPADQAIANEEKDEAPSLPRVAKRARLSMSAQSHQEWVRKKTRRWYAVVAGAMAGAIAIRCESADRRLSIAQQLFVRGLQGSYNHISNRHNLHIPHGDVIVFALSCAQIMYGFTMRPDTLPRWYNTWIGIACEVSPSGVNFNRSLVREGTFAVSDIDKIIRHADTAPRNLTKLMHARELVYFFMKVFRWMLPMYGALHLIPMLLFKRQAVWWNPAKMLLKAFLGTMRSSAFLGVFVIIYHSWLCGKRNIYLALIALRASTSQSLTFSLAKFVPQALLDFSVSKSAYWFGGLMCGLALFVEEEERRSELAMYVLPRSLEAAWVMLRGKGYACFTGTIGDILLTSFGMGMVMSTYQNDPEHLSGLVRRILYQFIGPN